MRFSKTGLGRSHALYGAVLGLAIAYPLALGAGRNSPSQREHQDSIVIPAANPTPDANDQMKMRERQHMQQNFDAVNALRRKQIDEEAVKLLILARDLKHQVDSMGDGVASPRLQREAAVIELLAHDVQTRMTLTVGRE